MVLEKKTTTQGFSGPEQLPETDMVAASAWLAPCSLQLCIFKLRISPGFTENILLGICLPTKLPLPSRIPRPQLSPFHSTFSSPSDTLAPHVPVPPALFYSCEVQPVKPAQSSFSHLQPAPPTRERVFTWRPSLTLGQILYRWRVPVLPSSYSH